MLMVGVAFKLSAVPSISGRRTCSRGHGRSGRLPFGRLRRPPRSACWLRLATGFAFPPTCTSTRRRFAPSRPDCEHCRPWRRAVSMSSCCSPCWRPYLHLRKPRRLRTNEHEALLAYSTIAHAGYMMMPVAAAVSLLGTDPNAGPRRRRGAGGLHRHLFVHEPCGVRHRRLLAQRDPQREIAD